MTSRRGVRSSPPAGGRFRASRLDASEQVALEIRRYLSARELRPGERLGTEQELAAEFGVSRPTLREGLRRAGKDHAWAVIAFEEPGERDRFVAPSPA